MFKIGDFSKLCRVPVSALRYYADIGLLEPTYISDETHYRYYSLEQLPRLNRILALKDLGLTLNQIKDVLQDNLSLSELQGMLKLKEHEMAQEIEARQAQLTRVQTRLQQIKNEGNILADVEVVLKEVPAQPVLSLREIIPVPDGVATLFMEAYPVLMSNNTLLESAPLTIFHDSEFKETNLDVEILFPIEKLIGQTLSLSDDRQLTEHTLPAVEQMASIIHVGAYEDFMQTYGILGKWIEHNQYRIAGVYREIYLRPADSETQAITEIQIPVERI